jgi:hypothetical protein
MRSQGQFLFFVVAFSLLMIAAPGMLLAADIEIIVNNAAGAVCSNSSTPACYTTIQSAIDFASNFVTANTPTTLTYSIRVEPGTYAEAITLKPGVSIVQGRETARTILINGGSGPVVTASNLSSQVSFRNFSIVNATTGIAVSNSSAILSITNNVFSGTGGTAVTIQGSPSTNVINNTFYRNGTAVVRDSESNQIANNIFSTNTVNISQSGAGLTSQNNITYNDFNPAPGSSDITGSFSIPNLTNANPDPLFVDILDISRLDFHLKTLSPCIGNGDPNQGKPNDMGAYGGTNTDSIPMQVSSVNATISSTSISLTWNANLSYSVTGYRIYYGRSPGVYDGNSAAEGVSPVSIPSTTTATAMLSGLSTTVVTPAKPVLNPVTALNESLVLSWDAVPGATGYRVYSDIDDGTPSPPTTLRDTVTATSDTLTGLTNNSKYKVAVSAISQTTYYIAVTAVNTSTTSTLSPGIANESAYSQEVSVPLGGVQESAHSDFVIEFPEAIVAFPNLQNRHGCFIATAAYGHYSSPEVQALRSFRDRYLLTNSAGSAFVRWYYEHSPVAAAWLDAHPGCKPMVRQALMPAVGLAIFMTGASSFIKAVVALFILIIVIMTAYRFSRKRISG